jgi:hypothetical protein
MIAHTDLSLAFFLNLCTLVSFRSFSLQSYHLNLVFLFSSSIWFPQKYFLYGPIIRHSYQMTSPFLSLTFIVVTVFGFLYITCNSSLVQILQLFWSFIGPYTYLSVRLSTLIFWNHFFCCVIAHVSQSYNTIGLTVIVHIFSFVSCHMYLALVIFERAW